MPTIELIILSISLAMDAFAVSICKGLNINKTKVKEPIIIGIYFGLFQAIMPLIGFILGKTFESYIISIDHWLSFIILVSIGISMIYEAIINDNDSYNSKTNIKTMIPLAVATSIDALAVGITFAFLKVDIIVAILIIGIITFTLSFIGVKIGNIFGDKHQNIAKIIGGTILITIGIKILLEHLEIL